MTETASKATRAKARKSLGPLHDLLTEKLPDFLDEKNDVCHLHKLADNLNMTYQGVYKWFRPGRENKLPMDKAMAIITLSSMQTTGELEFEPMTQKDIWPFISS